MLKTLLPVMVAGCMALSQALAAEPVDEKTKSDIQEMLRKHDEAVNQHDLDGVLATYGKSDDIVLMGTGPGEVWVGKEAIADTYKHIFENFDKGAFKHECPWKTGGLQGDTAWLMASCQMKEIKQDETREYVLNVSAVLKKNNDAWQFQNMHFSNLTGGSQE
jgi:uncharacterized protein (TIGR02246 family)